MMYVVNVLLLVIVYSAGEEAIIPLAVEVL